MVNTPQSPRENEDSRETIGVSIAKLNYQVSPLECLDRGENDITLPHDNLPPYLKVYIWECTEITDDERIVTCEPTDKLWVVTFLGNDGTTYDTYTRGDKSQVDAPPSVSRTGFDFIGWKCPDGITRSPEDVERQIVTSNLFYVAQWSPQKFTVTFRGNGGEPDTMFRQYDYGEKIGHFPTLDAMAPGATSLKGWYTSDSATDGSPIDETETVTGNTTYYAQWNTDTATTYTVKFFNGSSEYTEWEKTNVVSGSRLGTLPAPTTTGYSFKGWFTQDVGGIQITPTYMVKSDVSLYAHWEVHVFDITWDARGGSPDNIKYAKNYGEHLGVLPTVTRLGYGFKRWYDEQDSETQITENTEVFENKTYIAEWLITNYGISYDLKGGNVNPTKPNRRSYTVETDTFTLNDPIKTDATFIGWTGSNGNIPKIGVKIPKGSTGLKSYVANWQSPEYEVVFQPNGGVLGTGNVEADRH